MHMSTQPVSGREANRAEAPRAWRPFGTAAALAVFVAVLTSGASAGEALPEAGPENGGLRLRLLVSTRTGATNETYSVRADLFNVTDQPLMVAADWPYDSDKGEFKDYFESAVSIETTPKIMSWGVQVMMDNRKTPQPTVVLQPKGTLSAEWESSGRRLKNKLTRPYEVRNPYFPTDGLYTVHAELKVRVSGADQPILLRSNEQSVPVGGDSRSPKFPLATVTAVSEDTKLATIDLGSLHGIEVNDEFLVLTGMNGWWLLTIVETGDKGSKAAVKPGYRFLKSQPDSRVPKAGDSAGLVPPNAQGTEWMSPRARN